MKSEKQPWTLCCKGRMNKMSQVINKFVLGEKELEGKMAEFQYDRGWYSITDIIGEEKNVIQFKDERNEVRFSISSKRVLYIESSDNYSVIKYISNEKISDFLLRCSLKKLSTDLKDTPIQRCHRSYMINLEHITSIKKDCSEICFEFDTPNIKDIPISKSYNDRIMDLFVVYSKH